jgi:3-deoxy-D-manno-octulosonic-acid transferase
MALPSMYSIYTILLALALLLSLPYWVLQALLHGKYRAGLWDRLGRVPEPFAAAPASPVIWAHAVSVGEVVAISGLIAELKKAWPRHRIVISTTTDTGQELARSRFGAADVFYFPLDFEFAIAPYLKLLRPELIVIAETEFWPNFLRLAKSSGARIAVVNARISDRSLPGYRRWRRLLSRVLQPIDLFLVQSEADRSRLLEIGAAANRVQISGNLKFDIGLPAPPPIVADLRRALQAGEGSPVIVCGSTMLGEEEILLRAFDDVLAAFPHAVMILAPRHPQRFVDVAQILSHRGIRFWRRSQWTNDPLAGGVFLADSIGELAFLYALGNVAFVGGSLVPTGGHNLLEPAAQGIPTLVGPHTENFRDVVNLFQSNQAVRVVDPAKLSPALMELLTHEVDRVSLGHRAAELVRTHRGATQRTLGALEGLLERSISSCAPQSSNSRQRG